MLRKGVRKQKRQSILNVINDFKRKMSFGPDCVCAVCLKLLFKNQVVKCNKERYKYSEYISERYLHKCNDQCHTGECTLSASRSRLWICYTCHRKLIKNRIPAEASFNNLALTEIPEQLKRLNTLEQHLIAQNIAFMKIINLPKGGQNGVIGPCICVPANVAESVQSLPRTQEHEFIRIKLKCKLSYKGYYEYQFINKQHVEDALNYLRTNNKWYNDIVIEHEWINPVPEDSNQQNSDCHEEDEDECNSDVDEITDEERLCGVRLDSCMQPADIGQEILDQYFDGVFCVAPCEGNNPVRLLMEEGNEAKCFPRLFPKGEPIFSDKRDVRLTLCRLMNVDNRFSQCTDYIFYAQYLSEIQQVLSCVSIALRKGSVKTQDGHSLTASMLNDKEKLKNMLKSDSGYKFLKPIRGTPPYWASTKNDVLSMIRQLGVPTWFCSFSAADMRWPELINTILKQQGDPRTIEELDWNDKCMILKSNPVTVARLFDRRFHLFLKDIILSDANPIGKVKDYFYRVEFQLRGSPHTHCLFWIEDAPVLNDDTDDKVVEFIDKYISCNLPAKEVDDELNEISNVQMHSRKHSKSCKKKGTECRFNFPRPPSERTFVIRREPIDEDEENRKDYGIEMSEYEQDDDDRKSAADLLKSVREAVLKEEQKYKSVNEMFKVLGITQEGFEKANKLMSNKVSIVLKRNPQDVWVNQYNPDLSRAWNANLDIQYITDIYGAVAYVVSYMSKAEREMGLLLSQAQSESVKTNVSSKESMRQIGQVYLQNREVSAQEACFRVCNLRLKEGSRKVEFIPLGENPVRMSLPLRLIQNKSDDDDDSVWMVSKLDRYKARPKSDDFDAMCLATFCSKYRILSSTEALKVYSGKTYKHVYQLQNGLGHIQKRTRTDDAVIKYPRFSVTKFPEKYYHSILQLFLPHRIDAHLKPADFETYEEFYNTASVKLDKCNIVSVKFVVQSNRQMFEANIESMDDVEEYLAKFGPQEDAWALICPETEVERHECRDAKSQIVHENEDDCAIPDLQSDKKEDRSYSIEYRAVKISRQEAHSLMRSLNEKQSKVFYKIRQWCLDKVNGKNLEPFHMFITGGAGTGKSHLIKCIYNEAVRLLGRMSHNPDDVCVLLTAPTGVAAYNINGLTIHSALSITTNMSLPYTPLGEEKISTLRNKLDQLQILIIDEISMVDQKMLCTFMAD